MAFLELDEVIQQQTGLALQEIFELHGEAYYRAAERDALERVLAHRSPAVVAVSGGIVGDSGSFRLLRDHTRMVWLRATPEEHMGRVVNQGDRRPVENRPDAMKELRQLLAQREPFYEQAELVVDTHHNSTEECMEALVAGLSVQGGNEGIGHSGGEMGRP